jgi:hypothetical protein
VSPVFLVNEGTVAVGVMAIAMAVAFLMVVGLGAYVLYCDAKNRAGEHSLVAATEPHSEPAAAPEATSAPAPSRRRRPRPPAGG